MDRKMVSGVMLILLACGTSAVSYNVYDMRVSSQAQRGPRLDTLRYLVTRSPAAQQIDMVTGISEAWAGLTRLADLNEMNDYGKTVSTIAGLRYSEIAMNYRCHPLDDVNFRHVLFHLVPKDLFATPFTIRGQTYGWIVDKIDTPVPSTQVLWYNPSCDPHPYSRDEARTILASAGYILTGGVWMDKDGSPLPTLRFFVPLQVTDPVANSIGMRVAEEAIEIGLTNIVCTPMDSATYIDMVCNYWDFELAWLSHNLGATPIHLYRQFSSEQNYLGSNNPYGIVYPELNASLSVLFRSLYSPARVQSAKYAQELLMGGSISNPLPYSVQPSDPRYQALPAIPIYSSDYVDVLQPYVRQAVNMKGYGISNFWAITNIYKTQPGPTDINTLVWIEKDYPARLNPLWARTDTEWNFMGHSYDKLITANPYTLRDEPWLATSWSYAATPGGMNVTFDIRLTDSYGSPITWADGKPISISDVKFSWDFLRNNEIPRYFGAFAWYDPARTIIVDSDTIVAFMSTTSPWLIYDLADTAFMLPPQVWAADPRDGLPWSGTNDILSFDPSAFPYPDPDGGGPLRDMPTHVFGTGPYILGQSTDFINNNGYGDLDANRNYWLETADIEARVEDMFWRAGDAVDDDRVDLNDLVLISFNFGITVPPADARADTSGPAGRPDGQVDVDDLATAGSFFASTQYVPEL
jgi:ABC-type transport system substrate-binding protein